MAPLQLLSRGGATNTTLLKAVSLVTNATSLMVSGSRTYLGPTAMDAEVAFLMANQAKATHGKLVYDPFVRTGSILLAAAHYGAMTMGADIDIRVVRDGRGPDCNVWSNFKQDTIRWC